MADPNSKPDYGRPDTKAARLRRVVHELLLAHEQRGELPTSNRFLFYELIQSRVLDKSKTRAKGRGADRVPIRRLEVAARQRSRAVGVDR